ncbi:succinate-semialdehyde dehydrogenase/glutarate-semialdehyde dehydrogenase [Algoriphagus ratkowskyi]|uniref:NAD-dependent succinate-semialdehyde dehydrogenase n=1 Tax=Algoriphagus ratkowskyi TaxID=57028 RepID=A0A2W7RR42_9BACT|nr:NAD-dependent succinate-semialdehyde dehydrogenase [Algoriphagus ratkowskyi]PZX56979.1 succinate-semialdehyde dehydrogenase/glutarate-semialdehyde dehydrogenase [Algoriphagus ratkowskyi]TXD79887.1 NAD-dependent succinate-semialdehyde dehydrogenase [Algoriphagus ratkowskyi]
MEYTSTNPYNGKLVAKHRGHTSDEINSLLALSQVAFKEWRKVSITERAKLMRRAGEELRENVEVYAEMITLEMGKPISESRSEIKKCASVCDYYADNTQDFLADEIISTEASKSFVKHEPIGTVLAVMPWNFPFWQVFRFAAPTLMAGNVGVLKHASNVLGCAKMIEEVFSNAGFPSGVFQNLIFDHEQTENVIKHEAIKAVTLTGSEGAGAAIAALAGKYLKKSLMELGGNNAFIVWKDANIDQAVEIAVKARMLNCGQSCIAAKRFILIDEIYEEFVSKFLSAVAKLKSGDTLDDATQIGPLARKDLADDLHEQVKKSIEAGAELLAGGNQNGCFYEPTVLGNVKPGMPAFDEETFGPLAAMIRAKDIDEAFELAENSKYGLGVTVCTTNIDLALEMSARVSDGAYFVNELVKSDPRLPFGGTKKSGYGRELAKDGMMEFINRKTIYVKK